MTLLLKWQIVRCSVRRLAGGALAMLVLLAPAAAGAQGTATAAAAPAAASVPTESQREAATLLKSMAQYLAGLRAFTCSLREGYDVVQASGQKIEFGQTRSITLLRPGQLRVEEVSSDGAHDLLVFDGRNMTVYDADSNVYAQAPEPGSLDDAIVYFVRDLRMRFPLAQLLTTRLPAELPTRVKAIDYVEETEIDGQRVHHVAGRTDTTDFQIWIAAGERPVPLRVVITYVQSPGEPQFWANFSRWNLQPKLPANAFEFAPPKDARRIAFAVQVPGMVNAPAARGEVARP